MRPLTHFLNINCLLSHNDELRVFMSSSKIDILVINESKLDSTVHHNEVYVPGFELLRKDRKINGRNSLGVGSPRDWGWV